MERILNFRNLKHLLLMMSLLLAASTAVAITPKIEVQCVLVEKAQIARLSLAKEGKFGRANHGHQIVTGTGTVLAIRIFDDPDRGPDSELFTKATLEFKQPPRIAREEELTVEVVRSHFSKGSSGWVTNGGYWWAKNVFPRVQFRRDSTGLHATLKQVVHAIYAEKVFRRPPESLLVDVTCPVRTLSVIQLTPWTGRVGTDYLSFYSQGVAD